MYISPAEVMKDWDEEEKEYYYKDWPESSELGFAIFNPCGYGMYEIERIDDLYAGTDVTDEDCAREAERIGYCKIIPVDELPKEMPENMRYFGWVDTPENRKAIANYCERR